MCFFFFVLFFLPASSLKTELSSTHGNLLSVCFSTPAPSVRTSCHRPQVDRVRPEGRSDETEQTRNDGGDGGGNGDNDGVIVIQTSPSSFSFTDTLSKISTEVNETISDHNVYPSIFFRPIFLYCFKTCARSISMPRMCSVLVSTTEQFI